MSEINWMDTPCNEFDSRPVRDADGMFTRVVYLHGNGEAQQVLSGLQGIVEDTYWELIAEGDRDRYEGAAEVPVIRNGQRRYEDLDKLTLRDLPAVLDTFVVLEEERKKEKLEEDERKKAQRKERKRILAKERRKLKKLGEWYRVPESN